MALEKKEELYEGKAKKIYKTNDANRYIMYFKDDATAFNAGKKGTIVDKGIINNKVSERMFNVLEEGGVKTHFVERISDREMVVKNVEIIMVEIIVRNVVAGSMAKRMGVETGKELSEVIVEYCYKSDELGDPFINASVARAFDLATQSECDFMEATAIKVNNIMNKFFDERGIRLVDFKLEFGRDSETGEILLADEVTPDGCRLWEKETGESLDKDRFRQDLGKIEEAYQEVLRKVMQ